MHKTVNSAPGKNYKTSIYPEEEKCASATDIQFIIETVGTDVQWLSTVKDKADFFKMVAGYVANRIKK